MRGFFYKTLNKYLQVFIRPEDSLLVVDPEDEKLFSEHSHKDIVHHRTGESSLSSVKNKAYSYILLNGNVHYERDIETFLNSIHSVCSSETRVAVTY
ncbi:MAG TPA: hypothetical protein PL048_17725, partial [Leptospiraceae bacterium]|nr:hypothetical protein [Leptospiraceae bacterium]